MKDFIRYRTTSGSGADYWSYMQDEKRHSVNCDKNGWISVNDLLPEPGLIVIVGIADGWRDTDYRLAGHEAWDKFRHPIGWQPLPEPMDT